MGINGISEEDLRMLKRENNKTVEDDKFYHLLRFRGNILKRLSYWKKSTNFTQCQSNFNDIVYESKKPNPKLHIESQKTLDCKTPS